MPIARIGRGNWGSVRNTVADLRTRQEWAYVMRIINTIWRFFAPPLWVIAVFLSSLPLWILGTFRYLVTYFLTLRMIPFIFLGMGLVLLPFQESQQEVLEAFDVATECLDVIVNGIFVPSLNDIFHCVYPLCRLLTMFNDLMTFIFRFGLTFVREYFVTDFADDLEEFLEDDIGIPGGEVGDIVQAIIDYLDIDVCDALNPFSCTGNFYDSWDNEDVFGDVDIFWPPGPDRSLRDSYSYGMLKAARHAASTGSTRRRGKQQYLRDLPEHLSFPTGTAKHSRGMHDTMSSYADGDSLWKHEMFRDAVRQAYSDTALDKRTLENDSFVFDLFSQGPHGYNTIVFGFLCGEIEEIVDQMYYLLLWFIEFIGQVAGELFDVFSDIDVLNDPSELMFFVIDFFWRILLRIPCIEFNDEETFFVSLIDCTCKGVEIATDELLGGDNFFVHRPADKYEDLPATLLCCIGLCCFMEDPGPNATLPSSFDAFFTNFVSQCIEEFDVTETATSVAAQALSVANTASNLVTTLVAAAGGGGGFIPDPSRDEPIEKGYQGTGGEPIIYGGSKHSPGKQYREAAAMDGGGVGELPRDSVNSVRSAKRPPSPTADPYNKFSGKSSQNTPPQEYWEYVQTHPGSKPRNLFDLQTRIRTQERLNARGLDDQNDDESETKQGHIPRTEDVQYEKEYQRVMDYIETRSQDMNYPQWLVSTVIQSVGPRINLFSRAVVTEENPLVYMRRKILGDPLKKGMATMYRNVNGETGLSAMASHFATRFSRALFDVANYHTSRYGIRRSVRLAYLTPSGSSGNLGSSGRRHMQNHWLKRYAVLHPIEEEAHVILRNDTIELTDGQLAVRAISMVIHDTMDVLYSVRWMPETYDFYVPSHRDIGTHLEAAGTPVALYDGIRLWLSYVREHVATTTPRWQRNTLVVETEVAVRTMIRRFIAPELLGDLEREFDSYGGAYTSAAFRITKNTRESIENVIESYVAEETEARDHETRMAGNSGKSGFIEVASLRDVALQNMTTEQRKRSMEKVRRDVSMRTATAGYRTYLAWSRDRRHKARKHIEYRKTSYDFQRRLATHLNKTLVRLDPKLPLPTDPRAEVTDSVAARYYVGDYTIKARRNESRFVGGVRSMYQKFFVSAKVSTNMRGVDPAIVDIFANMESETMTKRSDEFLSNALWANTGIMGFSGTSRGTRVTDSLLRGVESIHAQSERLPQVALLIPILKMVYGVLKQWRWFVAAIVPILSQPQFRIGAKIGLNPWIDLMGDIYTEGLKPTFSPANLEQFGIDFGLAQIDILFYLTTSFIRFLMCNFLNYMIQTIVQKLGTVATLMTGSLGLIFIYPIQILSGAVSSLSPLYSYCPPVIQLDNDGVPVLKPWNYVFSVIDCDPNTPCSDATDCPGMAPCRCSPCTSPDGPPCPFGDDPNANATAQYTSWFWSLDGDFEQNCPGDSGRCLCWPRLPCDFDLDPTNFNEPFNQDCEEFGWCKKAIVWYQKINPFRWIICTMQNWYFGTRFITRTIVRGHRPFFSDTVMLAVGLLVIGIAFASRRYTWMFFFILVLAALLVGGALITNTVIDLIIPALENLSFIPLIGTISDWLITFLRFDGYSDAEPLGEPDPGELVCFAANSPSFLVGTFLAFLFFGLFLGSLSSGFFLGILYFLLFFLLYPFRRLYDIIVCIVAAPDYGDNTGYGVRDEEDFTEEEVDDFTEEEEIIDAQEPGYPLVYDYPEVQVKHSDGSYTTMYAVQMEDGSFSLRSSPPRSYPVIEEVVGEDYGARPFARTTVGSVRRRHVREIRRKGDTEEGFSGPVHTVPVDAPPSSRRRRRQKNPLPQIKRSIGSGVRTIRSMGRPEYWTTLAYNVGTRVVGGSQTAIHGVFQSRVWNDDAWYMPWEEVDT